MNNIALHDPRGVGGC